jgi:predicted DNA-binding protein
MSDQGKSSRSGLKRPDAPVDLFTLQPEPDLIPDSQVEESEKPEGQPKKQRAKRPTSRKRSTPKPEPVEEKILREDKNEHVSVYLPGDLITRLDLLKRMERERLRDENKKVSRSTLIQEAVEQYLEEMEK